MIVFTNKLTRRLFWQKQKNAFIKTQLLNSFQKTNDVIVKWRSRSLSVINQESMDVCESHAIVCMFAVRSVLSLLLVMSADSDLFFYFAFGKRPEPKWKACAEFKTIFGIFSVCFKQTFGGFLCAWNFCSKMKRNQSDECICVGTWSMTVFDKDSSRTKWLHKMTHTFLTLFNSGIRFHIIEPKFYMSKRQMCVSLEMELFYC